MCPSPQKMERCIPLLLVCFGSCFYLLHVIMFYYMLCLFIVFITCLYLHGDTLDDTTAWGQISSYFLVMTRPSIEGGTMKWLWITWIPLSHLSLHICVWAGPPLKVTAPDPLEVKAGEVTGWEMICAPTALMASTSGQVEIQEQFDDLLRSWKIDDWWRNASAESQVGWAAEWALPSLIHWKMAMLSAVVLTSVPPASPSESTVFLCRACWKILLLKVFSILLSVSLLVFSE